MKPPVLLCFNLSREQQGPIRLLAMRLMIRMRAVSPEEFGQSLGALCGLEPAADAQAPAPGFDEAMLVLSNFNTELLQKFLSGFKIAKIPPVELKAVLTETNVHWNSVTLHRHLAEERAAMAALQSSSPGVQP